MKRFLFLGIGSALMFTMGGVGPAQADNGPHVSSAVTAVPTAPLAVGTDGCASCHRVHTAKGKDYLIRTTTQAELCYTCHGTAGAGASTDVQGGVGYASTSRTLSTAKALRGGGFEKAMINSGGATAMYALKTGSTTEYRPNTQSIPALTTGAVATTSNHSVDASPQTIWGNGAVAGSVELGKANVSLECGSCHDPHGNKNYRILKPIPVDSGTSKTTDALGVATTGISIPDQPVKEYTTSDFWKTGAPGVPAISAKTGLTVASPDGFIANISDWCITCHTRYNGQSGARSTASGDAVFMYRHTTSKIDVVGTRNCITCHVAHGSNAKSTGNSDTVSLPGGAPAPAGDSRLLRVDNRGICLMCHNV